MSATSATPATAISAVPPGAGLASPMAPPTPAPASSAAAQFSSCNRKPAPARLTGIPPSPASPHGLVDEGRLRLGEQRLAGLAIDRFAADLQHHRHGQRGNMIERLVDDVPLDAPQHGAERGNIEEAGRRFLPGRAQQD